MAKKKAKKQALKDDIIDLQHDTSVVNEIPSSAGRPQRPSVSPYAELPVELGVGSDGMTYYVPRHLLPLEWIKTGLEKRLSLDKIDKETGHTLVHYLYSKEYETLDIVAESPLAELCVEFTRALLVFIMTVRYNGLTDLRNLASSQMQDLGAKLDICEVLGAIKDHFSKLESHSWIHEYVRERVTVAFAKDTAVFKSTALLQSIGDADYVKFVMGCVMDSYDERVSRMAEVEKVLSEELDKHRRGNHTPRPENPMADDETVQEDFSLPDADMDLGECHEQRAAKQSELLNEDLDMAVCSSPGYSSSITGEGLSSSNVSLVDYPHEPSQKLLQIDELDRPLSQVEAGSEQHKPSRTSVEIESNAGSGEAAIETDGALAVETKQFSPKRMIEPGDIPQPCSLQAEHMLEEKMWRDCELCRAMLLKIAIQLGQVV